MTTYRGIDYGLGKTNIGAGNIRFAVIPMHDITQAWCDSSESVYPENAPEDCEPLGFKYEAQGYTMHQTHDDSDVWITDSPYFTYAQFCSPCAPGACHLRSPLDMGKMESENRADWVMAKRENRCFCLGPDWFEDGKAPYPIYDVKTGDLVSKVP